MPRGKKTQEESVVEKTTKKRERKTKEKQKDNNEPQNVVSVEAVVEEEEVDNNIESNDDMDNNGSSEWDSDNNDNYNNDDNDNNDVVKQNTNTRIERGSVYTENYRNNNSQRVKVVETEVKGKTYNKKEFERKPSRRPNRPVSNSVLRFSYNDAIRIGESKTLSEATLDETFRYLIATNTDKRALCNVLRNTLTGIHNETTLPQTTYVPKPPRNLHNRRH